MNVQVQDTEISTLPHKHHGSGSITSDKTEYMVWEVVVSVSVATSPGKALTRISNYHTRPTSPNHPSCGTYSNRG
jgi:hypothetical protein